MAFNGLSEFVSLLDREGELIRVEPYVNSELIIAELADRFSKQQGGGKALLFESTGTRYPVLVNAFGSDKRMAMALGVENIDKIGVEIEELFEKLTTPKGEILDKLKLLPTLSRISSWMPKTVKGRGACQEVVNHDPDLSELPILKCWPADGGAFVTLPCVVTRDPHTGTRNVGMYRMQVFDRNTTGVHWHKHKTGARHFNEYKKIGKKMPVSVVLGGDPAYTYAATAPLPDNIDEYLLAGFLRKKRVKTVKCLTNDLEVPSDADFIIEGYVDPEDDLAWEGPFGDHTGFYSLADWYPRLHVTCITHRQDAIYPATVVGIPPMEDAWIGRATERIFLAPMRLTIIPEIVDISLPPAGVAHNITIAGIEKSYPGQAAKVMNAMWGAGQMMFNKIMIITGDDVNIHNFEQLARHISKAVNPSEDISFSQGPMDVLDHSSTQYAYGSKMGIDATSKGEEKDNNTCYEEVNTTLIRSDAEKIPEVKDINTELLEKSISLIVLSIEKREKGEVQKLAEKVSGMESFKSVKFVVFIDSGVDIYNLHDVCWYVSGNIDPRRDCYIINTTNWRGTSCMVIDGTRKTKSIDGFERDWPNPVTSSLKTINSVNEMWESLGVGEFIPSPSLKYHLLKCGEGAVSL